MKFLLIIFIALFIALSIGIISEQGTGQVIIHFGGWDIQASLAFFLVFLLTIFMVAYTGIRFFVQLWHMPDRLGRWRRRRHQRLADKYLTSGLLALVEGDWQRAEKLLQQGIPHSQSPLIYYLGAARAAQKQGAVERRDQYLRFAHKNSPDTRLLVSLTQAELQINQHQTEQALATLTHLHEECPDQKKVKLMLLKTYSGLESWREVLDLLPEVSRSGLLPREMILAKQLEAYAGLLKDAGNRGEQESVKNIWREIPKKLRKELYLIEVYCRENLKFNDTTECEPIIKRALKKYWDSAVVRLYGQVEGKDAGRQLAFAEGLLPQHARDPVLLLILGRLCIRNSLWGKARSYLEESLEIHPEPETYRELAELLEKQGEQAAAADYYQQGLALATADPQYDPVKLLKQGI